MRHCRCVFAPLALIAVLAGCATAPAPGPSAAGPAPRAAAEGPEHTLLKGMTAAQVRQIMGDPAEIHPQPVPKGKVEVWVYRRSTVGPTRQVQIGTKAITDQVMGADGVTRTRTLAQDPVFRQEHQLITETIQLLMFDDLYLEQKVTASAEQVWE
jgi:hypothetical protein